MLFTLFTFRTSLLDPFCILSKIRNSPSYHSSFQIPSFLLPFCSSALIAKHRTLFAPSHGLLDQAPSAHFDAFWPVHVPLDALGHCWCCDGDSVDPSSSSTFRVPGNHCRDDQFSPWPKFASSTSKTNHKNLRHLTSTHDPQLWYPSYDSIAGVVWRSMS